MLARTARQLYRTPGHTARSFTTSRPFYRPADMKMIDTTKRLERIRHLLVQQKVDIYIVPSEDPHSSEYIAPTDARREYISGFSGSAGTAVITQDKAALATDGRYFNQASKQLDGNWELLKQGLQDVPTWQEWAVDQAAPSDETPGLTVGVDPTTITAPEGRKLHEKIKKKGGKGLVAVSDNLVDKVWGKQKPDRPNNPAKVLSQEYAGKRYQDKVEELRKELDKKKAAGFVRHPVQPRLLLYAVVTPTTVTLYIDETKLSKSAKSHLEGVTIRPYSDIFSDIAALAKDNQPATNGSKGATPTPLPNRKYLISTKASWALSRALGGEDNVEEIRSLIGDTKAVKNATELEGMRQCHIRDGAALIEYFAWLEDQLTTQNATLDEVQAADKLEEIRSRHEHFVGLSFPTISSTGANAAVIHYGPEPGNCSTIDPAKIYLCDSGAQYLDGTTDTTRTLHFGEPTAMEREAYTLVLKGHIALDRAVFPKGTSGFALDTLARQHLWASGLEYRHGTGHGVGSYLNVHEGPIGIGTRIQYSEVPLAVGNVISNEPGYYEDGEFGIRIENIVMVREVETKHKFGEKPFLGFEHVTMVPMCRKLVNVGMLTEVERRWLDDYHKEVLEMTAKFFEGDERSRRWLERECAPYDGAVSSPDMSRMRADL
ncbi:hypothetical protein LTR53_013686 [Teratosphaeriaceae sp. CCFEE 6253]|nr:hypothetical protein LTR53_013686 [Teratosphaeriaceae sp. CCFEE 6253]